MSWLSSAVGKIPVIGGAINSVAHNVVDPALRGIAKTIPGGSTALAIGDAVGGKIPAPGFLRNAISGGQNPGAPGGDVPPQGGGNGGGGIDPLILGLAGLQTANAAQLGKTGNDFSSKAWGAANDSYQNRAGLRSKGIAGLMQDRPMQNTSGLSALRMQNPIAAQAAGGAAPAPKPIQNGGVLRTALRAG